MAPDQVLHPALERDVGRRERLLAPRRQRRLEAGDRFRPQRRHRDRKLGGLMLDGVEPMGIGARLLEQAVARTQRAFQRRHAARMLGIHRKHEAVGSIALKRVENPVEFGIVITTEDGSIERFLEKPTWGEVFSDTINTGIYILEPGVFDSSGAAALVELFARCERLAAAGRGLAARRVEQANGWREGGHRSSAHWLAAKTGVSVGAASRSLATAQKSEMVRSSARTW